MIHDQRLVDQLSGLATEKFDGEVFRATGISADPLAFSVNGGRWAPPARDGADVPVLYTSMARDLELYHFALITSRMHMAWTAYVGGRLKSDYQYSPGINYNPFPWPVFDLRAKDRLSTLAQAVLDARADHPGATLADLYDADVMPGNLRRAHEALDRAVDRLYRPAAFSGDRERVEHLFGLYEGTVAPLTASASSRATRRRRAAA